MPSQPKSDTARANGAKSRGSNSAATREISSRNCLPGGPAPSSSAKTSQFPWHACEVRHLPSRHPEEHTLLKEMVAAPGGIERLWTAEASLIDLEMVASSRNSKRNSIPAFSSPSAILSLD